MNILEKLQLAQNQGLISEKTARYFEQLYQSYTNSLRACGLKVDDYEYIMELYLERVLDAIEKPYQFEPFHKRITTPFNYYRFGLEYMKPLVDMSKSTIEKEENIVRIAHQLANKENVVFFANHQTEVDPQVMCILFEQKYPQIAEEIIFVAGDRVITDPMAIPFSMGCNLLCIYSKKHIENPPENKLAKQLHNRKTMKLMSHLFSEGGKCIYVAPSGGRDRPNEEGKVEVAPFDPQSIEMFRLMAAHANRPTHFYPLALATFNILPPPKAVQKELGEVRIAKREGARMCAGSEIDMNNYPGNKLTDKHQRREALAQHIWQFVNLDYQLLSQ